MDNLIVALFEIISFGAIVVLVVLGLGIIASMMGIFNFAHGEFVLLGAYVTYVVQVQGLPVWLGMVDRPSSSARWGLYWSGPSSGDFTRHRSSRCSAPMRSADHPRDRPRFDRRVVLSVPEPLGGSVNIGTMQFSTWRLVIILITALVMVGSYLLLSRTAFGLRIRASLENPALARASGISTNAIYGVTFAFGAALAGLAGALIVPVFSLFADLGLRFLIQGFVAVMVGGVGSFAGPVAGAGVIGTLAAALPWVIPPVIADVLVFVLAIVFIKFRPQGLVSGRGV